MQVSDSLVELVGNTPLVRLSRFSASVPPDVIAKVEYVNPGGSVKDRIGLAMIEAAERDGLLRAGGTIVEPTSGNTGAGLAIAAAHRGYRCVFVMPDKMSQEKIDYLRAYGAEVVVCPTAVEPDDPRSYYRTADRLTEEIPGAFQPNQYWNAANPEAHYRSTGPEIWTQTDGRIDVFVTGVGTGGTISGVGRYLKEQNPGVQIVGADPEGSLYSGDEAFPYLVEGVGEDFIPGTFDPKVVDRYVTVSDRDSFLTARRLAREEGLLVGGSAGLAAYAALAVAAHYPPDATIVVLLPDSGRSYLSKIFNDDWMDAHGFLDRKAVAKVTDVIAARTDTLPKIVHVHPDEPVRAAIATLHEYAVSQMPVVKRDEADSRDDVLGSIRDRGLLERVYRDPAVLDLPVGDVMEEPLPMIDSRETVDSVMGLLTAQNPAVLVCDGPLPTAVLTRADVLEFLMGRERA